MPSGTGMAIGSGVRRSQNPKMSQVFELFGAGTPPGRGQDSRVIGPQGISFWGRLVAIDDYDIELVSPSPVPSGCRWAIANGQEVCIGKAAIFKVEQLN